MAVAHSTVTVGTAAVSLIDVNDTAGDKYSRTVLLSNPGTNSVFLGGPDVTTGDFGYELQAGGEVSIDLGVRDVPYAIAAAPGESVRVLHLGV